MSTFSVPAAQGAVEVTVLGGPRLLADLGDGPGYAAHRRRSPELSSPSRRPEQREREAIALVELLDSVDIRGRGGAGFPIVRKIRTALQAKGQPVVVVNAAEGEPASSKDSALMLLKPHLVLDGAQVVARTLRASVIHLVVPGEREAVHRAAKAALAERAGADEIPIVLHQAECRFVAGESSAVLELLAGRPNLPVTTSKPSAVSGLGGQPTVLSNAETFAQVAMLVRDGVGAYCSVGTTTEPGTRLLTIDGDGARPTVLEVPHGERLGAVLAAVDADADGGLLLGGYHGAWLSAEAVSGLTVSPSAIAAAGASIGAGIMLPLRASACPVRRTTLIVSYLAGESANRCGPCRFGLPALAEAMREVATGTVHSTARLLQLAGTVEGRGACHHPDGTTRAIRSLLAVFPHEVEGHLAGTCPAIDLVGAF